MSKGKPLKKKAYKNGISTRRCDVFSSLRAESSPEPISMSHSPSKQLLPSTVLDEAKKKRPRKRFLKMQSEWSKYEALFRKEFPPETAAHITKRHKRQIRQQQALSEFQYQVLCSYVNKCRRSRRTLRPNREKRSKNPRRLSYETYIDSSLWADRKNRYYRIHKRQCAACGSFQHIHLHHMVYGEFGQEPDEHLIPLCEKHHNEYHSKNGTQRRMIERTMTYVTAINEQTGWQYVATSILGEITANFRHHVS